MPCDPLGPIASRAPLQTHLPPLPLQTLVGLTFPYLLPPRKSPHSAEVHTGYPHFSPLARIFPLFPPLCFGRAAAKSGFGNMGQSCGITAVTGWIAVASQQHRPWHRCQQKQWLRALQFERAHLGVHEEVARTDRAPSCERPCTGTMHTHGCAFG